ncbi:MAG: FAD-binding oxidoreductase [Thermoleophilia bacterium]
MTPAALSPGSQEELAAALREASVAGTPVEIVGGGTRSRSGRPPAPDGGDLSLNTRGLDQVIAHEPEDLTLTVEAGMPAADAAALAASAGQAWPQAQIRPGSTVGGVLATASSSRARLRSGPVRDSVLQMVVATGDGRLVTAGGRTVKGVSGFDLPRLAVGAHGTLGVITQVTLKLWPVPAAQGWFGLEAPLAERLELGRHLLGLAPSGSLDDHLIEGGQVERAFGRPVAVLLTPGRLDVELAGPPDDVRPPVGMSAGEAPPEPEGTGIVEAGVPPPRLGELAARLEDAGLPYEAWMGVGICLVAVADAAGVGLVRGWAAALGGHAQVRDAPDAMRDDPWGPPPPGVHLMRRLRDAFDPAGILNRRLVPWP